MYPGTISPYHFYSKPCQAHQTNFLYIIYIYIYPYIYIHIYNIYIIYPYIYIYIYIYSQMSCLIFSLFPSWVYFQKYMECKAITLKSSQTMSFSVQSTAVAFPFFLSKTNVLLKDSMRIFCHLPLWLDPPTTWGYFVLLLFIKYIIFWALLHLLSPLPGFYFCYSQACSILS